MLSLNMKVFSAAIKQIAILTAILLSDHISIAQQFYSGAKAGVLMTFNNFSDQEDKSLFNASPVPGFYVGGIIGFPLKKSYSFQAEGGFSQRGRKMSFDNDIWQHSATYYFWDLGMVLRKSFPLKLGKDIPGNWFFNIGPSISYWIDGSGKINNFQYALVFDRPNDGNFNNMYLNNVNRWLFGIDFGIGITAPLTGKQKLVTELRFTSGHTFYGNSDSHSIEILNFQDNLKANQKTISLSAAYVFDFNVQEDRKGKSTKDKEVNRKPVKKTSKKKKKPGSMLRLKR